jgi:hypothetical protein
MVQAGSFHFNQDLACFQRSKFLNTDLNHLRTAGAKRPRHPALNRLIHDESPYHRAPESTASRVNV